MGEVADEAMAHNVSCHSEQSPVLLSAEPTFGLFRLKVGLFPHHRKSAHRRSGGEGDCSPMFAATTQVTYINQQEDVGPCTG